MRLFFLTAAVVLALQALPQKKGQALIDSLVLELPLAKNDTNKVQLLVRISQLYTTVNTREGFRYAAAGMVLSKKLQWKKGLAGINNSLGLLTGDTGNNAAAREYFEKSFAINKDEEAKPAMIANMNNIGRSYQREADFARAAEYYFKAMAIAEESGNNEQAALVGTNLTALFINQQDYKKAAAYAAITIRKGEAGHALVHVAKAYELLGIINLETGDTAIAKANFEKALSINEQLGNRMAAVAVLTNLGTATSRPEDAVPVFLKVQQILDEIAPNSQNAIINLANLGLNYYTLGMAVSGHKRKSNFDKAAACLEKAAALCVTTHNPEYTADIKQVMSNLEEARGNYKAALENFKAFTAINDSVFSQGSKNKIAALESRRTLDLKNREIEKKELQISNQRKGMWLLISCIGFLGILGTQLYRQGATRKKINATLQQLNAELREANKVKAKFFGILSHDLRSPIANFINFMELQKKKPDMISQTEVAGRETQIVDAASSLLDTMETMLLWTKGQMDHFKANITPVPVYILFAYVQQFFGDIKGVVFSFSGGNEELVAVTDENYLKTIMLNLTANAIKALAATPGAKITWRAWQENGKLMLAIADNGPGVQDVQLQALYDDTAGSGARQGLGLHIIRDLAKAIKCSITLTPAMKQGTEFVLSLS